MVTPIALIHYAYKCLLGVTCKSLKSFSSASEISHPARFVRLFIYLLGSDAHPLQARSFCVRPPGPNW